MKRGLLRCDDDAYTLGQLYERYRVVLEDFSRLDEVEDSQHHRMLRRKLSHLYKEIVRLENSIADDFEDGKEELQALIIQEYENRLKQGERGELIECQRSPTPPREESLVVARDDFLPYPKIRPRP